jgi:hypothetical protein
MIIQYAPVLFPSAVAKIVLHVLFALICTLTLELIVILVLLPINSILAFTPTIVQVTILVVILACSVIHVGPTLPTSEKGISHGVTKLTSVETLTARLIPARMLI